MEFKANYFFNSAIAMALVLILFEMFGKDMISNIGSGKNREPKFDDRSVY